MTHFLKADKRRREGNVGKLRISGHVEMLPGRIMAPFYKSITIRDAFLKHSYCILLINGVTHTTEIKKP